MRGGNAKGLGQEAARAEPSYYYPGRCFAEHQGLSWAAELKGGRGHEDPSWKGGTVSPDPTCRDWRDSIVGRALAWCVASLDLIARSDP